MNMTGQLTLITLFALLLPTPSLLQADDLRERLKDANGIQTDLWVYNDIPSAMEEARRLNKPLFVTFRCVPCKDCAAFDADVANGNDRVKALAKEKFVSVRQVEMKGVDLSLFQFDHDLNWAGMFINADGVVYARYGTQSAEGSDAYNSIDGLINTMNRVLELHADYPNNKQELAGKRGTKPRSTALEMPGLRNPAKYAQETTRSNCIHCHNIHDAEHQHALDTGTYSPEMLWKHHLPNTGTHVTIEGSASGIHDVALPAGWKQNDFSWRGSMWNAPPRLQVWLPEITGDALAKLGLPKTDSALEARWINKEGRGGQQAYADGLREKDIIIAAAGEPIRMDSRQFQSHLKLKYKVGDQLPLTILRDGKKMELKITFVE